MDWNNYLPDPSEVVDKIKEIYKKTKNN